MHPTRLLLCLLPLVAGCMAMPLPLPAGNPGLLTDSTPVAGAHGPGVNYPSVSVSIALPGLAGYRTQYMVTDISRLVIGLIDLDGASTPYLGYEDSTLLGADPSYHAAIAGTDGGGGSHASGLLSFTGLGALTTPQKLDRRRYLYRTLTAGIGASRTVTFSHVKPGTSRYVAFAAAFTGNGVTQADAIGFSQTAPFTVLGNDAGNQANAAPALTLPLTRRMGSLELTLSFDEGVSKLVTKDKLIVTLVDGDATRAPYFGYEGNTLLTGDPGYHPAIAGYTDGTGTFVPQLFDYAPTTLADAQKGDRRRMVYHVSFQNSFTDPAPARTVRFTNLKPGGNYFVHAAAFQGGDGFANQKGDVQSGALTVTSDATTSTPLSLSLTN